MGSVQAQQAPQGGKKGADSKAAPLPVGEILRLSRVHYGQSLNDVESALRIRAAQLDALEAGRFGELPGRVYAVGFVRAYADYLGLDGDKMVQLFKAQSTTGGTGKPELRFPSASSGNRFPGVLVGLLSILAVAGVIYLFASFHRADNNAAEDIPPPVTMEQTGPAPIPHPLPLPAQPVTGQPMTAQPVAAQPVAGQPAANAAQPISADQPVAITAEIAPQPVATLPQAASAAASSTKGANASMPASAQHAVVLNFQRDSWIEVRNAEGKALVSQIFKPGESYTVPDEPGLVLSTGNIGGVDFVVNGAALPPLGANGVVARNIPLDPQKLIKQSGSVDPMASSASRIVDMGAPPPVPAKSRKSAVPANEKWRAAISSPRKVPENPVSIPAAPQVPEPVQASPPAVPSASPTASPKAAAETSKPAYIDIPGAANGTVQ